MAWAGVVAARGPLDSGEWRGPTLVQCPWHVVPFANETGSSSHTRQYAFAAFASKVRLSLIEIGTATRSTRLATVAMCDEPPTWSGCCITLSWPWSLNVSRYRVTS